MAILLDGKKVAQELKGTLKAEVAALAKRHGTKPVLASLVFGEDAASEVYLRSQARTAEEVGIAYRRIPLGAHATEEEVIAQIIKTNVDEGVHAIIIQTPLPEGMDRKRIMGFVAVRKDAEGLHPENLGNLVLEEARISPCTAHACLELLRAYNIKLYGREVVIVGHSAIVGKPLCLMLLKEFATTTVCHIATSEAHKLCDHVRRAEILIVAVGKANLVKGEWVRDGAVVLDVGINRVGDKIVGDVEFDAAQKKASYITPVPGGVGPLTVAMLMRNTVEVFKASLSSQRF